jgi:hypothetical protein
MSFLIQARLAKPCGSIVITGLNSGRQFELYNGADSLLGSRIDLTRALMLAGKSETWICCVDVVGLSSTTLAFSNAASKLRSMSILLCFAISAIASRSGSRHLNANDESRSVPCDTSERNFFKSHRIRLMSRHNGSSDKGFFFEALFGHLRFHTVLSMEELVRRANIPL